MAGSGTDTTVGTSNGQAQPEPTASGSDYFSHLPSIREQFWRQKSGSGKSSAAPPAMFLPLERLLQTQTVDSILKKTISSARQQGEQVLTSSRGSSFSEVRLPSAGNSGTHQTVLADASSAPAVLPSGALPAQPGLSLRTAGAPVGSTSRGSNAATPTAHRSSLDEDDKSTNLFGNGAHMSGWDTAISNALASLDAENKYVQRTGADADAAGLAEQQQQRQRQLQALEAQLQQLLQRQQARSQQLQPQPAAGQGYDSELLTALKKLQTQLQQLRQPAAGQGGSPRASQSALEQLQVQLRQLQVLQQKQEELHALQARMGQHAASPKAAGVAIPTAFMSWMQPMASITELQHANLKRSTSTASNRSKGGSFRQLAGMSSGAYDRPPAIQTVNSGLGAASSPVGGAPSPTPGGQGTRPFLSKRGAYPEFMSMRSRTPEIESHGILEERHSAPMPPKTGAKTPSTVTSPAARHTHTGAMSSPLGGGGSARQGAAAAAVGGSSRLREATSPTEPGVGVGGGIGGIESHNVTVSGPRGGSGLVEMGRVASPGLPGGVHYPTGHATAGSTRSFVPPVQEVDERLERGSELSKTNTHSSRDNLNRSATTPNLTPEHTTRTGSPAPVEISFNGGVGLAGEVARPGPGSTGGGGVSAGGGGDSAPLYQRQRTFGATGSSRFKVRPVLLETTVPTIGASETGAMVPMSELISTPVTARARSRAAVGSHQIQITLEDFKAGDI